jgi:hypothetical protein
VFPEDGVVHGVRNYINSQCAVKFKPLRPFPPVTELYIGKHVATVATTSISGRVVI